MMGITCKWSAARDCSECNEPICLRALHMHMHRNDECVDEE